MAVFIFCGCSAIDRILQTDRIANWSSSNPLSIPHDVRQAQFESGNLVNNPSFEAGRVVSAGDGNRFSLAGWEQVGRNVVWVDPAAGRFSSDEVYTGRHAVKIVRETANETDTAEGVVSDYIPVISGNYDFTFAVRLQNIVSNKSRLGVQLYDAIVVKIMFFDQNKEPVTSESLNPVNGTYIDNSDKGYAFSNYWRIDDFPWGIVRGRSYHYPFSEGDIPDAARYVRLFFGLKGTGTMWLDDVDYRYSKWNFTALERHEPFFNRPLPPEARILPTPKSVRYLNDVIYFGPDRPSWNPPVIVLPSNPAAAERTAAAMLQKKIATVLARSWPRSPSQAVEIRVTDENFCGDDLPEAGLVLSIGNNKMVQQLQPDLPWQAIQGKPQGYIVQAEEADGRQVVFLIGETPLANYYAAITALQLFDNDQCVYHNAAIADFPDFLGRAYMFKKWRTAAELRHDLDHVERMSQYKLNKAYVANIRAGEIWNQTNPLHLQGIQAAGRVCRETGVMSLAVMVNPYSHFNFEPAAESLDDTLRYTWTHGSAESFARLREYLKIGLDAGAATVMLLADDYLPHVGRNPQNYSLYTPEDRQRFVNLQNAQADVIRRLKQWIDANYPGTRFEFCPPWYSNEHVDRSDGKAEIYFADLTFQIPPEVAIIWTGPTVRSLSVDMADLHRYRTLIGRWPMFWDNTLYARSIETERYGGYPTHYPGKVRMCNLFEPYDTYRPPAFYTYSDDRNMFTNSDASSEVYKLKFATVADYLWNTSGYEPELALWKALCGAYGSECARLLLRFNDAYYGLYDVCLRLESGAVTAEKVETGRTFLRQLDTYLAEISGQLPATHPLAAELTLLRDRLQQRFEKSAQTADHQGDDGRKQTRSH